jgi:hypothetical protein
MGRYSVVFLDSNIIITGTVQIGLDWKPVGIAPMSGATAFPGLAMRQDRTGALLFFDVRDDKLVAGGSSIFLPENSAPTDWQPAFGGDFLSTSSGSTSRLVQAKAGFDDGSGAGDGLNGAPAVSILSRSRF